MKKRKIIVAPSIICSDFRALQKELQLFEHLGIELLHCDIMDGHFVPNITFGPEVQARIHQMSNIAIDSHLMIAEPDKYIERFAQAGSSIISVHAETCKHLDKTLNLIRSFKVRSGVAISPDTPLSAIEGVLDKVDTVLVMTVNPGFTGQKIVPHTIDKVAQVKSMIDKSGLDIDIQADGNVSPENIPAMLKAGANILVGGTASLYLKDKNLSEAYADIKKLINQLT